MFNYLAFIRAGLTEPGASPIADGNNLAADCLQQLKATGNPEQFPPRLLILLTSPAYQNTNDLGQMLNAIRQTFADYKTEVFTNIESEPTDVPLIGSSVEAVFFYRQVYDRGALLICLASRMIEAQVCASRNLRNDHEHATNALLEELSLNRPNSKTVNQKPLTGRLLMTFFPNIGRHEGNESYLAPRLHQLLLENSRTRIPIVGGVSSRPGFQFRDGQVCYNEMVAAKISSGAPFSSSFGHGLNETDQDLRVKDLAADGHTVLAFDQSGAPAQILGLKHGEGFDLLGELSLGRDPMVTVAEATADGKSVTLLRKIKQNALFRRLAIGSPEHVRSEAKRMFENSLKWWMLERPIGCFAIHCSSRRRSGVPFQEIVIDAEEVLRRENTRHTLKDRDLYFGGYFDGEAGMDESGRPLFGNWCLATLCFSDEMDEMRERTPAHTGFKAISDTAPLLTMTSSLNTALNDSLKIIFETGFPGAMLSLVMKNMESEWFIAKAAIGARFEKILEITKRPHNDHDILAIVAYSRKARFIHDSSKDEYNDPEAVRISGVVSQYILPLFDRQQQVSAILQFDLGDLRRRNKGLYEAEERILTSLGAIVEATILRVLNREEADLTKGLDLILMESLHVSDLSRALQLFIKHAAKLFNAEMGHIRLLSDDGTALEMAAGVGDYYDAFKVRRQKTLIMGDSPTALAFRQNGVVVVNDSTMHPWQAGVLRSCQDDLFAHSALGRARSFANTPITDASHNQHGTISLMSPEPWFFTRPRVRAMESLNQRAAYLIKHFKAEKERKFLLDIGSDFVRNADFAKPVQTITQAVKRFRLATNADYAGLFIWDDEADRFILRAQDGWANDKWVDAVRYKMGERWTGGLGTETAPQYVPDMFVHKKDMRISSDRLYENHLFGDTLSEHFTVEAIGLPLRLKQETIGLLTLYRRRDPKALGKHSGFTTTDSKILQEAADTLSAMLSALLYNLRMDWWKQEMKHHEEVREALEKGDRRISLEQRLCHQIVHSFNAERAIFYLASSPGKQVPLMWAAAANQHANDPLLHQAPDKMVIRAARGKSILEKKKDHLSEEEWKNPIMAKTEGLLERACLPLWRGEELIGVLDLRFRTLRTKPHLVALHDPHLLEELAGKIALVFQQQRELEQKAEAEAKAERGKLAVQAMGAMVFQTAHRLMNLTQSIRSLGILIETAGDERERNEGLSDLFKLVNSASDSIKRPMEVARRMKAIELEPQDLHFLIAEALLESDIRQQLPRIDVGLLISPKLTALADHELMREAFRNTIHNAVKAMPGGGSLRIWAGMNPDRKTVQVTFTDTGYGMSEEEKQAALSGFVTTPSGTGLGVLVSLLLIRAQDGNLEIESKKGEGTKVTVTLPAI